LNIARDGSGELVMFIDGKQLECDTETYDARHKYNCHRFFSADPHVGSQQPSNDNDSDIQPVSDQLPLPQTTSIIGDVIHTGDESVTTPVINVSRLTKKAIAELLSKDINGKSSLDEIPGSPDVISIDSDDLSSENSSISSGSFMGNDSRRNKRQRIL
jgi:hypothetical protein